MTSPSLVLKLGGAVLDDPATLDAVASELAAVRAAGVLTYVVHGGGPQLDAAIKALGEPVVKHQGLRVTSVAAAAVVQREMDALGRRLAAALEARGLPARQIPSAKGLFEATPKRLGDGVDLGRVGTVVRFHHRFVSPARPTDPVGVLTPVGLDRLGPLNVNADEGAAAAAAALTADWLLLGTDVPFVRDAAGRDVRRLDAAGARSMIADGAASGGMIPKLTEAVRALDGGVRSVLIARIAPGVLQGFVLDGRAEGTLVVPTPEATT